MIRPTAQRKAFRARMAGMSLMEVMVALGIAMVLLSALAGLFSTSVKSRQQVDREGQKIENGRYALDSLAEDIRLAGYFGTYAPSNRWASVDWKPVSPFTDCFAIDLASGTLAADRTAKIVATTEGWTNSATTPEIPVPVIGFETHSGTALHTSISKCLPNYSGGDVLVIRRASTTTTAIDSLSTSRTYLQSTACANDGTTYFVVAAGATGLTDSAPGAFTLRPLSCTSTSTTRAEIRELITRVYYVASENESGDGIPTLKVLDLSSGSITPRSIAPGIENLHIEYGLDNAGSNGTTDTYALSSANPLRIVTMPSTTVGTALGGSWTSSGGEDKWEDAIALKVYLIARDLEATTGNTSVTYNMGQVTASPASTSYKTRMSSTTIRITNQAGRRE